MDDKEIKNGFEDIKQLFRETDRRIDERFRETDRKFKETDIKFKETDLKFKESAKQLKELGKQIGGLANKFGSFTEGMAFPSMQRILMDKFKMEFVSPRVKVRKNGDTIELDVFAYANAEINEVYVVEVKSHVRSRDLEKMIYDLKRLPRFLPEHKNKQIYGILAAVDVTDEMKKQILDSGIYLALIRDDTFCLDVPENFKPKRFN